MGAPLLKAYPLLRPAHVRRLRACFAAAPAEFGLNVAAYYRMRMDLMLRGLRMHGGALPYCRIEGREHLEEALSWGRPVVLLGLHGGPLELLHRIPEMQEGKPFLIVTAPAFAPALTRYMARGRERDGKRILWTGGDGERGIENGLRACLAGNGMLALMADQHPGAEDESEFLELWGRIRVPYPGRMLRFLAKRTCRFVPVSVRLAMDGVPEFRYHPANSDATPRKIREFLEDAIADAPDQWNWSYPKIHPVAARNRAAMRPVPLY